MWNYINDFSNPHGTYYLDSNASICTGYNILDQVLLSANMIDDLENKNRAKIVDIILMVQEEVARRITATEKSPAKQYGLLTILSQFWADCSIIRLVGRKSFYPAPKVNSALVSLKVRKEPLLKLGDYKHFRKTIKAAFSQRRKTLKNCLSGAGFDRDKVSRVIEKMGLDENIRGEKLSIKQLGELSENLCD